ncbi:MAG TPA: endolytic transglycosylase MltG [Bryobacteraceae bacterium]|nr:endolytic transglycosylase MltG [Bryobacteraceae bacterium]
MTSFTRFCGALGLAAIGVAGFAGYRLFTPYRGFQQDTFVEIPRGAHTSGIADLLAKAGVIRSQWDFLLARSAERGRVLKAGEYRFQKADSVLDVYNRIARGDIFYYTLVVPEGKNIFDIATAAAGLGLFDERQFLDAARDATLIHDIDPHALSLEGYLFPGTYRLSRHTTPQLLCQKMTARFREVWGGLNATANPHETITLASLVEKEAKLPEERSLIAAVFDNRLKLGMKLDCDPTTIYAALLESRYRGTIYRSDLDNTHPYNTYQHAGLPPGPIANPGLASIQAALNPDTSTSALYFVLRPDGSGGHEFSETLARHTEAVTRYHRAQAR